MLFRSLAALVSLTVSAAVGSLASRTAAATVAAYAVLVSAFLVPLAVWSAREAPFGHRLVERCLCITPLAAALAAIRAPGFSGYDLVPASWWVAGIVTAAAVATLSLRVWRLGRPQ